MAIVPTGPETGPETGADSRRCPASAAGDPLERPEQWCTGHHLNPPARPAGRAALLVRSHAETRPMEEPVATEDPARTRRCSADLTGGCPPERSRWQGQGCLPLGQLAPLLVEVGPKLLLQGGHCRNWVLLAPSLGGVAEAANRYKPWERAQPQQAAGFTNSPGALTFA
jgi:hypothetical protein